MYSIASYSEYAYADAPSVSFIPPALLRIAESLTANHVIFLEISARENTVTTLENPLPSAPNALNGAYSAEGYSTLGYSSSNVPRVERETETFLFSTRPWTGSPTDPNRANERADPRLISAGLFSRSAPIDSVVARRGERAIGPCGS